MLLEMKTLKFIPSQIEPILNGLYNTTWRLADEKNIQVDDEIQFINSENGNVFTQIIVDKVTTKRIEDISSYDIQGHESYGSIEDIIAVFKKYYGPDITTKSLVKIIKYHLKDQKNVATNTTTIKEVKMYTDGGSRGNPGPSASGYVIYDSDDNLLISGGEYLGITTNNQAEYQAVRYGLKDCAKLNAVIIHIYMDSLLVVNQMNGVFKIKNRELWPIHSDIKKLIDRFKKVTFTHVPRELNKAADAEVNRILDLHKNSLDRTDKLL